MAISIFGITFGGESARLKDAQNGYAIKYPISGDINQLRQNLGTATIELSDLKGQTFESPTDKRTQQRNITALTIQTIKLQSAIKDANLGVGNSSNNFTLKLPTISSLLNRSPYATSTSNTNAKPSVKPSVVGGLDKTPVKQEVVDNTDGGQPQGAKGDYPPPQGVQSINYGKWIGLGLLGIGIVTTGYILTTKNKK